MDSLLGLCIPSHSSIVHLIYHRGAFDGENMVNKHLFLPARWKLC